MAKELVISASPHETKVALLEEDQVVEVSVEREKETGLVGSIYKGRVTRVLPGMQSAFVDIGLERDAFLYVSDYFEGDEEYEHIVVEEGLPPAPPETAAPTLTPEPDASEKLEAAADVPGAAPRTEPAREGPSLPSHRGSVPDRRRLGRRSYRGQHRGHRGGRGRGPGRFDARPSPPLARTAPEEYEPIILPGESLAKYRDRIPQPQPEPLPGLPKPAEPDAPTAEMSPESNPTESPTTPAPAQPAAVPAATEPEPQFEERAQPAAPSAPLPESMAEPSSDTHLETARRKQEAEYISVAEVDVSEPTAAEPESVEAETEAPEGFGQHEVPVEEENGSVALPPSVRERTAGGVKWERPRLGRRRGRRPRERRPRRAPGAGPRPRISELLQPGQETIVQIAKEQIGTKGARITSHVTLPGRYVVYMPTIEHVGVSRRIRSEQDRNRLRRLLLELKPHLTGGIVVRTAAEAATDEEIRRDLEDLVKLWHDIRQRAEHTKGSALLHRDLGLMERILRDQLTTDFEAIWIDNEEEYTRAVEYTSRIQPALVSRIKLYTKETPIFEELGIQKEIDQALRPKVWLNSGGYIVINHTEALVAIDINTGKYVGKGSTRLEDTIVRTNLDAVKEIVRQIRLRDLGGIIIIDFIDMEDSRNRRKVMQELERALRNDRSPSKMLAFNEFGLIAITRKRVRQPLEKVLCQPCPYCAGTGMMKSLSTLCYEIQEEARKMARTIDAPELTIRAHPDVARALKARESGLLRELEEQTGKNIIVQSDQALQVDQYNIF